MEGSGTGMANRLTADFFQRPFLVVARDLVGCTLVWDGCGGEIVELEAYAVEGDPACHTMVRPSAREFVRRHAAGTSYVYLNYGMYWLLNVLVKGGAEDGILLIRALRPTLGMERMRERRGRQELRELCSGPGRLGQALGLGPQHHGLPLTGPEAGGRGFLPREREVEAATDIRVGISRAADRPWRFLIAGDPNVSVPLGRVRPVVRPAGGRKRAGAG